MEGGVSGTLGTPLSLLETLWASINETSMKEGAHLMTPMTYLTLLFTTYPFHHFTPTATVKSFPLKGLNHLVLLALLNYFFLIGISRWDGYSGPQLRLERPGRALG